MKTSLPTFALFFVAQLFLWGVSMNDNIASGGEILVETLVVGVFVALFFAGYRWGRWVASILLGLFGLLVANMTFEGYGFGFLSVALLYGATIVMLFRHHRLPPSKSHVTPVDLGPEILDWALAQEKPAPAAETFRAGKETYKYPLLVKRYQSVLIDVLMAFSVMIGTMVIFGESEFKQAIMLFLGVIFVLLYEPLLTTYAATPGQFIIGIRVRNARNPAQKINILQAYIRVIVKWLLGWLSVVTINFNPQHRAIHDLAGASVVIRVK
jgi:uncharacterized RDD family membrane protein YckC